MDTSKPQGSTLISTGKSMLLKLGYLSFSVGILAGCNDTTDSESEVELTQHLPITIQERSLPQNSQCEFGGQIIETGFDTDKDGNLTAEEVVNKYDVCNGAPGLAALVSLDKFQDSEDCPASGVLISSGLDINGNTALDDIEVVKTVSVCDANPFAATGDGFTSLVVMETIGETEICPEGGSKILSGLDADRNTELDSYEILSTEYLCNGVSAEPYLARSTTEEFAFSDSCPRGGIRLSTGTDINRNDVLDENEIFSTTELCHGFDGQNGTDGLEILVDSVIIESSEECPTGGVIVLTGMDANTNQILDEAELNDSFTICNGATGIAIDAIVNTEPVLSNANCSNGGIKIISGLDLDRSKTLDESEIESSSFICNGEDGSDGGDGFNLEISLATEPSGTNCPTGGTKVSTGLDTNRSGSLESGEITKSYYVCNGTKGDKGQDAKQPETHFQSVSEIVDFNYGVYPECEGSTNATAIRSTFYSSVDTEFTEPLQVCTQSSCTNEIANGVVSVNGNRGSESCYGTHKIDYFCDKGTYFDSALKACVPSVALCDTFECMSQPTCLASGGNWTGNSCRALCPVGTVSTSRGCEAPIVDSCALTEVVEDNICVPMDSPTIITGGTVENPINLCGSYPEGLVFEGYVRARFVCESTIEGPFHAASSAIYNKDDSTTITIKRPRLKGMSINLGNWIIEGQNEIVDPFFGTKQGDVVQGSFIDIQEVTIKNVLLDGSFSNDTRYEPTGGIIKLDNVVSITSRFTNLISLEFTNSISINDYFRFDTTFSGTMLNPTAYESSSGNARTMGPFTLTRLPRDDSDEIPHWTNRRNWGDIVIQEADRGFRLFDCVDSNNCLLINRPDLSVANPHWNRKVRAEVGEPMEISVMCFDENGPYMGRCGMSEITDVQYQEYRDGKYITERLPYSGDYFVPAHQYDFSVYQRYMLDGVNKGTFITEVMAR